MYIARISAQDVTLDLPPPAMAEHPTASWQAMQDGNVFYRRQQLYSIGGKLPDLGNHLIAGCRNGGPIGAYVASTLAG